MRHYSGRIGCLNNTPLQQAHRSDPLDPNSDEMAVDEDKDGDTKSNATDGPQDIVMNGRELEVGVGNEEGRGRDDKMDEGGDEDEDEDEGGRQ